MNRLFYYLRIWWLMSKNAFLTVLQQKLGLFIFLFGKLFRFGFYYLFLVYLVNGSGGLVGYDPKQIIFFYLTFYALETSAQFLFREVYKFRPQVVSGSFDLTLLKPFSALFRALAGGADIIDLCFLPFIFLALATVGLSFDPTFLQIVGYIVLLVCSLIIATAFHILVISLGILTLEVDYTIMIYRDLTSLGRFPIEIFRQPIKFVITFIVPIGIMYTFPAKFMLGLLDWSGIVLAVVVACLLFVGSLKFWKFALRSYTSASS